jgi:hypothetical protein
VVLLQNLYSSVSACKATVSVSVFVTAVTFPTPHDTTCALQFPRSGCVPSLKGLGSFSCAWTGTSGSCDGNECIQSAMRRGGTVFAPGDGSYNLVFADNTCGDATAALHPAFNADGTGFFASEMTQAFTGQDGNVALNGITTFKPVGPLGSYSVTVSSGL